MIGLCKECFGPVYLCDEIIALPGAYECQKCGRLNDRNEMYEATASTEDVAPDHELGGEG